MYIMQIMGNIVICIDACRGSDVLHNICINICNYIYSNPEFSRFNFQNLKLNLENSGLEASGLGVQGSGFDSVGFGA